jgi:hypothetical protein
MIWSILRVEDMRGSSVGIRIGLWVEYLMALVQLAGQGRLRGLSVNYVYNPELLQCTIYSRPSRQ